jgi:hypothetical protein
LGGRKLHLEVVCVTRNGLLSPGGFREYSNEEIRRERKAAEKLKSQRLPGYDDPRADFYNQDDESEDDVTMSD